MIKKRMILHPGFTHCSVVYNKEIVIEVGGYNEKLVNAVDYDLWIRVLDKVNFCRVNEVFVYARLTEGSLTRTHPKLFKNNIYNIQNHNIDSLHKYHTDIEIKYFEAWREYFYGNKEARKLWMTHISLIAKDYRIIIGIIATFLPQGTFYVFK